MHDGLRWGTLAALVVLAGCLGGVPSTDGSPEAAFSFAEVADEAGFAYNTTDTGVGNGNDGVYVADYDNDLDTDVLAIGGTHPVLFHNTGSGFERSGALPSVSGTVQSALFFDHDLDGWQDLVLFRRNGTPVFLDNRNGTFRRTAVGLNETFANPVAASAADYNGDGCPDLFVAQSGRWADRTPAGWQARTSSIEQDNGNTNVLYRGSCGGFERAANDTIRGNHWSLATSFADLNGDGRPDIHVANDFFNDTVYYNTGNGTFERVVLGPETDRNGMSSEVADLDGDNRTDVFVTNIYFPDDLSRLSEQERQLFEDFVANRLGKRGGGNNALLGTEGDRGFAFAGQRLGVDRGGWGWAAAITDFDNDGKEDVFHTTQTVIAFNESDPIYTTPMLWAGTNGSFRRVDTGDIGFGTTDGRGVAHLDFDRSGSADLALATYDDRHRLYRNNASVGNSLQVRVKSGALNHTSLGARVYATAGGETHRRVNNAKADYQSQGTRFLHFGLGDAESVSKLRVVWPDGTERVLEGVSAGQRIVVTPEGVVANASYRDGAG